RCLLFFRVFPDCRQYFTAYDVDVTLQSVEWDAAEIHLPDIALMAKHFMLVEYFFYNLLRAADIHYISRIRALCEMLFGVSTAVRADHPIIDMRIDLPLCLLRCFGGVEKAGSRHRQPVRIMPILLGSLPVYINRVFI